MEWLEILGGWSGLIGGILVSILGGVLHVLIESEETKRGIAVHLVSSFAAALIGHTIFGDLTTENLVGYLALGYVAPSFVRNVMERYRLRAKSRG